MVDVTTWLSTGADVIVAGAAVAAAWYGIKGLTAWRAEAIGRRRVEVAEDVLASFYRIRELIYDARSPFVSTAEVVPQPGMDEKVPTSSDFAPWRRISADWPFIVEWRAKRHTFSALFGREAASHYDQIFQALNKIRIAVEQLLMEGYDPHDLDYRDHRQAMRRIAFRTKSDDDDDITKMVDTAVAEIEKVCRPVIVEGGRRSAR